MNIFKFVGFMFAYLRGVLKFRAKEYKAARSFFEKAIEFKKENYNKLLCQYYGQTLLCLNNIDESFVFLSKSYNIYNNEGWKVSNDEEYRLAKDTLDALKYLDDKFDLKVEGFVHDRKITITGRK